MDANGLAQLAIRMNLISEEQWRECWDELEPGSTPESLLRLLERKAYLTPWQGAKLLKGDTDGYFLGGYRLLYRIAAGTFGRVYRAENPRSGEVVAIKVLRRKWSADNHKIEMFEREGKMGMNLRHPNIVSILAVSRDPLTGQYFIVMDFVEGGNLRDILTIRKKLEPQEALRIMEDAVSGLVYAHSRGLTHRDIKLTNILLSTTGEAKLVDFGLAEITGAIGAGVMEGDDMEIDRTVDYAGLERATGQKAGDVRSDIYFLGCTLYEMVTSRPLLSVSRDAKTRMMKHRFDVSGLLRQDDPDLPPPLRALIARMVALEPLERYQLPSQLLEAVRMTRLELAGAPVDRAPTGPKSVFVIEHHPKLQDVFRDKLKKLGYRVLISIDANRAAQRYQQQPFHALIIDCGTAGEEGLDTMEKIQRDAGLQGMKCAGIIILSEEQADWSSKAERIPGTTVLVRPVTMGQITEILLEHVPVEQPKEEE